jgi:hypothetical protein
MRSAAVEEVVTVRDGGGGCLGDEKMVRWTGVFVNHQLIQM